MGGWRMKAALAKVLCLALCVHLVDARRGAFLNLAGSSAMSSLASSNRGGNTESESRFADDVLGEPEAEDENDFEQLVADAATDADDANEELLAALAGNTSMAAVPKRLSNGEGAEACAKMQTAGASWCAKTGCTLEHIQLHAAECMPQCGLLWKLYGFEIADWLSSVDLGIRAKVAREEEIRQLSTEIWQGDARDNTKKLKQALERDKTEDGLLHDLQTRTFRGGLASKNEQHRAAYRKDWKEVTSR